MGEEFKYSIGDVFLFKDFIVKASTVEDNLFIQSKTYNREIGSVVKRWIDSEDGHEYYKIAMDDGYSLTLGEIFLNDMTLMKGLKTMQ